MKLADQLDAGTGIGSALTDLEFFRMRNHIAAAYIPQVALLEKMRKPFSDFRSEVELESEQCSVELPPWVGEEVTDDPRYFNLQLVRNPYSLWE